jgi:hypothetical protein
MILFEPAGGICNRLRAMVSAQRLALDCRSSLIILWRKDHHLSASFDDLFVKPREVRMVLTVGSDFLYKITNAVICRIFKNRLEQTTVETMNRANSDYVLYAATRNVFIRTYSRFHCESDFSLIKPIPEIVSVVDGYNFDRLGVVGVHIRRTDNQRSSTLSPTELFIEAMRAELAENPSTTFFVATDSPDEERQLQQIFPGRIIVHTKSSLDRNDPRAIRDAMIDLYCLARCRKLIGSYWSSFTDTAASIGGMPLQIVKRSEIG